MVRIVRQPQELHQFPQHIKVVLWADEEKINVEDKDINSILELNTLLQEVKQYNDDPFNKEGGYYKTIISN